MFCLSAMTVLKLLLLAHNIVVHCNKHVLIFKIHNHLNLEWIKITLFDEVIRCVHYLLNYFFFFLSSKMVYS